MIRRQFLGAIAGAAAALMVAGAAMADPAQSKVLVDAAKTAGVVGEQYDGYLNFVRPAADEALKAAVAEINAGRAAVYARAAAQTGNGATAKAAGESAFKQFAEPKLAPGQYYKPAGGDWTRK